MYMLRIYYTCTDNLFCQGFDQAPGLDIMLLKQQHLSVPGQARQHPMCTVAAIPWCSEIVSRGWLSGLQINMLLSWMCLQDLTRPDPGVWPHSIESCRHASCLTRAESTFTPSSQWSSSQICIAGLCAPGVTHSTWNTIDFGEEMSRWVHIHGICIVYHVYMLVIVVLYTCTDLIVLTAGLFDNYPSSSILHWRAWRRLVRCRSLFDPDSMWFVRPQLFFHCTLRPIGTAAGSFNRWQLE